MMHKSVIVPIYKGRNSKLISLYNTHCRIAFEIEAMLNEKIDNNEHCVIHYDMLARKYGVSKQLMASWLYPCGGSENSIQI